MEISEVELIRRIRSLTAPFQKKALIGIGDDAAVIEGRRGYSYLFTTDTLVEGVHFRWELVTPHQVGWKALAVNVSDIAAMGGYPVFALVTLGIPISASFSTVKHIYRGMLDLSSRLDVEISGGDVVRSSIFFITISVVGEVESERVILRSGAKPGDSIYVTGDVGAAATGLLCLMQKQPVVESAASELVKKRWLMPFPRVKEARALSTRSLINAMIDLSDGLSSDLYHILEESCVGAEIWEKALPMAFETKEICLKLKKCPTEVALQGGEDYELLFTTSSDANIERRVSFPITKIGKIVAGSELFLVDEKGQAKKLMLRGWDHFLSPPPHNEHSLEDCLETNKMKQISSQEKEEIDND